MTNVTFRGLGTLEVVIDGRQAATGGPLQRGLLATLLLHANRVVASEIIIEALWDNPPETALGQVQTRVWRLRQLFQEGPAGPSARPRPQLVTRGGGYELIIEPEMFDMLVFYQQVARANTLLAARRPQAAVLELRQALDLWRGPAFADVTAPGVRSDAEKLEERRLGATELRVEIELSLGLHQHLVPELRELVAHHPFRERLRYHLMRALHRSGRRAEAVETYLEGYRALVDGLGMEPSREMREMHRAILASDGIAEREPAISVGPAPTACEPQELPPDSIFLLGRESETTDLRQLFDGRYGNSIPSIATISGVAGVGKSALAVRVAHLLSEDLFEGQLFAWIGELDPHAVLRRFLRMLGVEEQDLPEDLEGRSALYRACLASRRLLIVLDDVESEAQVRPLLPASAGSATLITSRRRLSALESMYDLDLEPLRVPAMLALMTQLVGLNRVNDEPDSAERIVRHCGGLPLAVRAIAARICSRPHWPLARFADVLDDEARRLALLTFGDLDTRAAIASGYLRLAAPTRRVFRALGCISKTEFAVGDVSCAADLCPEVAEESLEDLVQARMIHPVITAGGTEPLYRIDDLWHLFARECLAVEADV